MIYLSITEILQHPNENGISVFILGFLFVLTLYHFLLYFQHKDKTYLYYSLYTFLIFINHLYIIEDSFLDDLLTYENRVFLRSISIYITWTYNIIYFVFAFTFIDLKSNSIKMYKWIFRAIYFLLLITLLFEILYKTTGNVQFIIKGNWFFLVFIFVLAIVSYIPLFKIQNRLKYYIIIGSLVLFTTSLTAELMYRFDVEPPGVQVRYSIFYIGLIIENMFFSLGLGQKQKLILQEKNVSQAKLITQLRENEKLRRTINEQLEKDVSSLSKLAEIDRLDTVNAMYERELAELKVTLLRSQMNPHFIFNSLNSIKLYIINNEKENAVYYLNKFSKLIRKILASTRDKQISLEEEIETTELYMNIENIRFESQIKYSLQIDDAVNINTIKVPCLILQPFIENAIWHGLSPKKGSKKLDLIISKGNQNFITITIIDNGVGREQSAILNQRKLHKKTSIGIQLTMERLNNFYKDYKSDYLLTYSDLHDENEKAIGTSVELKLPLE